MALDWSKCSAVESVPGELSGAWVFRGTRIPVLAVFENLEDGLSIDELVALYDGLTRRASEGFRSLAHYRQQPSSPAEPERPQARSRDS